MRWYDLVADDLYWRDLLDWLKSSFTLSGRPDKAQEILAFERAIRIRRRASGRAVAIRLRTGGTRSATGHREHDGRRARSAGAARGPGPGDSARRADAGSRTHGPCRRRWTHSACAPRWLPIRSGRRCCAKSMRSQAELAAARRPRVARGVPCTARGALRGGRLRGSRDRLTGDDGVARFGRAAHLRRSRADRCRRGASSVDAVRGSVLLQRRARGTRARHRRRRAARAGGPAGYVAGDHEPRRRDVASRVAATNPIPCRRCSSGCASSPQRALGDDLTRPAERDSVEVETAIATRARAPSAPQLLPARLSASQAQSLVDCPYQFYARRLLRLERAGRRDRGFRTSASSDRRCTRCCVDSTENGARSISRPSSRTDCGAAWCGMRNAVFAPEKERTAGTARVRAPLPWPRRRLHRLGAAAQRRGLALDRRPRRHSRAGWCSTSGREVELTGRLDRIDRRPTAVAWFSTTRHARADDLRRGLKSPARISSCRSTDCCCGIAPRRRGDAYVAFDRGREVTSGVQSVAPVAVVRRAVDDVGARLQADLQRIADGAPLPALGAETVCANLRDARPVPPRLLGARRGGRAHERLPRRRRGRSTRTSSRAGRATRRRASSSRRARAAARRGCWSARIIRLLLAGHAARRDPRDHLHAPRGAGNAGAPAARPAGSSRSATTAGDREPSVQRGLDARAQAVAAIDDARNALRARRHRARAGDDRDLSRVVLAADRTRTAGRRCAVCADAARGLRARARGCLAALHGDADA